MSFSELKTEGDVAVLWLDQEGEKLNTLSMDLLEDFTRQLDRIESDDQIRAVVLISRKPECFIAGADIKKFALLKTAHEAEQASAAGNRLLSRMASFSKPIVAAINGTALGGGLEVALACRSRIATDHPKTVFGQPEVKLGLVPGAGGTQRLPRLIGLQKALGLLLTGKNVYPYPARKMGLVDEIIHPHGLLKAAVDTARALADGKPRKRRKRSWSEKLLEGSGWGRGLIYKKARKRVEKETRGNYPAPLKMIDVVRIGLEKGMEAGLAAESQAFGELMQTPQCRELIHLFFAVTQKKKPPGKAREVRTLGVLGAGLMGAGIAQVSALNNYDIRLKDLDQAALGRGQKAIWKEIEKRVRKRAMRPFERDLAMSRIQADVDYRGFGRVDLVIEAVFEDLDLKRRILAEVEAQIPDHCIFASNTSAIPITQIAAGSLRPQQVIGMHYFSPVPKMPLLEIVVTDQTADWVRATATQVGIRQGKTVIVVRDGPGFYTTRILAPLMNETLLLLEEGADIAQIDRVMRDFGFPVGPVTLMDEVGIDVAAHVSETMGEAFAARGFQSSSVMARLSEEGFQGRKNGRGFYKYAPHGKTRSKEINRPIYQFFGGPDRKPFQAKEIRNRLSLVMINEALLCLQEGILETAGDGDLGAVLGLGFPPFLGGPFRYVDSLGTQETVTQMRELEARHGVRFTPCPLLLDQAQGSGRFSSDSI